MNRKAFFKTLGAGLIAAPLATVAAIAAPRQKRRFHFPPGHYTWTAGQRIEAGDFVAAPDGKTVIRFDGCHVTGCDFRDVTIEWGGTGGVAEHCTFRNYDHTT